VGYTSVLQNDLAYTAHAPGNRGYLGGNIDLGRLNYGLGARIQVQPGSQSHTLRSEGPGIESREIFSGSMPPKRSDSGGTESEASRILTTPVAPWKLRPTGTGQNSDSAQLYPSEGRPLGFSNPFGVSIPSQGGYGQQPRVEQLLHSQPRVTRLIGTERRMTGGRM
jgi:hypothetical protein